MAKTSDLITGLTDMGLSQQEAWRLLDVLDRLTDGVPREVAEARAKDLLSRVLARRFGAAGGHERMVPPGYVSVRT